MTAFVWDEAQVGKKGIAGQSTAAWQARAFAIDSRRIEKGAMFVALQGRNHDGHAFLAQAQQKGARCAMVTHVPTDAPKNMAYFIVDDCVKTLRALAVSARQRSQAFVCAVTGSVGKTTGKEFIARALAVQGTAGVYSSQGNWNNALGVSLALAGLPEHASYGVFELGMNHAGEIRELSALVRPDMAVITRVSEAHSAHFNDVRDIARAKAEIFDGVDRSNGSVAVLCRDDDFYVLLRARAQEHGMRIVTFGRHKEADIRLDDYRQQGMVGQSTLSIENQTYRLSMAAVGEPYAMAACVALGVVYGCGLSLSKAVQALEGAPAYAGRGSRDRVTLPDGGHITVIDESYNASPLSMQLALDTLAQEKTEGRRIAVLGDMLELKEARDRHRQLGAHVASRDIDMVYVVGDAMQSLYDVLPSALRGGAFSEVGDLACVLCNDVRANDVIMVKGSAGMRMSLVCDALRALAGGS
ncbi:MAG: UDP-N-acetylmuramoyl-tripeptide--D-alanyl-D-alanine ligase [Alphaproteobacteria bacterium GM202ARS2]|nr:UDP-N-acetylmuramoyl-tripeptide--D-alanyl-D-alanine ligase [Alphaproteobacteria bacterium GM202ARS2]